jgi:UPF0755 protein
MNLRTKVLYASSGFLAALVIIFGILLVLPSRSEASIEVKQGTSTVDVAKKLAGSRVVRSRLVFTFYVKGFWKDIQAGVYRFPKGTTVITAARRMDEGDVDEYIVTIPEGWRITQIADRLSERKIADKDQFITASKGKEGYLFPDTYRIAVGESAGSVVTRMEKNFSERTKDMGLLRADLILASIIEREAKNDEERTQIAGVYANRLRIGMALQADPTIQYAKGSWDPITVSDYKFDSPYNTYLHKGLPPGPICNPGLKSLESAKNPAVSDFYYFFHTDEGELILSKTLDEHNRKKVEFLR